MSSPVVIIGAGVTGLSIGWDLVQSGQTVFVFNKGLAGNEASEKAAGMITPASEVLSGEDKLLEFFIESLHLYPSFIQKLEQASSANVDFQKGGSLIVSLDQDDERELNRMYSFQKELGLEVHLLTPKEVLEKEPNVTAQCTAGILAPGECFLDNRLLIEALKKAFCRAGGQLIENKNVEAIELAENKIEAVLIAGEKFKTDRVVVATGIHKQLPGLPDNFIPPIRPVKGQALEFKMNGKPPISHALRSIHRFPMYLVPRSDGRVVLGATTEEMGTDSRVTAGAMLELIHGASKALPILNEMEFVGAWVGHRAAARDHAPIIGPTDINGLYLALGMYRHGILVAPLVGKIMGDLIAHRKSSRYFDCFGVGRFK